MIKIIYKLLFLALLTISLCIIAVRLPIRNKFDLSLMSNKFELLRIKSKYKKIVFVGGSGLNTGLDSKMIAKELHYDVVNLGLYAGYGIPFLLNEIKPYLSEGDIVVIVPEYHLFYAKDWWISNPNVIKSLLLFASPLSIVKIYSDNSNYKEIIKYCSELVIDKIEVLLAAVVSNNIKTIAGIGMINNETILNIYGDKIATNKKIPFDKFGKYVLPVEYHDDERMSSMNIFSRWCNDNGVKIFFSFSCYPTETYNINKIAINNLYYYLKTNSHIQILCDPKSMAFPSVYFSDTANHLDRDGKYLRTQLLSRYLASHIALFNGQQ